MAVVVPLVMKYVDSAGDAKYYAQTRSLVQSLNIELTKAAASNGGRLTVKQAKDISHEVKEEINKMTQNNALKAYGIKAFNVANPSSFDDDAHSVTPGGDSRNSEIFYYDDIKSYIVAYNSVGGNYNSYHVYVFPNSKMEIIKHKNS